MNYVKNALFLIECFIFHDVLFVNYCFEFFILIIAFLIFIILNIKSDELASDLCGLDRITK